MGENTSVYIHVYVETMGTRGYLLAQFDKDEGLGRRMKFSREAVVGSNCLLIHYSVKEYFVTSMENFVV